MRQIIIWGYSMWNSLKNEVKTNIKDFFKVNGSAAGAIGAAEAGGLDWIGMSEIIQSLVTTGIVIVILAYNIVKTMQLIERMSWEKEERYGRKRTTKNSSK